MCVTSRVTEKASAEALRGADLVPRGNAHRTGRYAPGRGGCQGTELTGKAARQRQEPAAGRVIRRTWGARARSGVEAEGPRGGWSPPRRRRRARAREERGPAATRGRDSDEGGTATPARAAPAARAGVRGGQVEVVTRPGRACTAGVPDAARRGGGGPAATDRDCPDPRGRPREPVGYGNSWTARAPARIATVAAGYADGLIRAMGPKAVLYCGETPCPVRGRVSMDLITVDVTHLGEDPSTGSKISGRAS